MKPLLWLMLGAPLVASGCVRLNYIVRTVDSPVSVETLSTLRPGEDNLSVCLQRLGAPHHVFEYRIDGMALLWHYTDSAGWGGSMSFSPVRYAPGASFNFDLDDSDMPGAMLWFDADLNLIEWRKGLMRDLTAGFRRRPADRDQQQ